MHHINIYTVTASFICNHVTYDLRPWAGLLGVMASVGVPIPGWLNVGVAILVLPIKSAVNPFLYTYNLLMERRSKINKAERKRRLDRMVQDAKEQTHKPSTPSSVSTHR